ncbi:hypothetical protein CVT26_013576 [Gymnopilus dilepis]|uniref:Uncharacterized protein n=1 Tax=Gymnopilus dilepis TaxID=231916 RepID=A0A409Y5L9_9AGAR|nr:hypothetical protein CVT26_013576 [Gymnopilus dilepis]
MSDSPVDPKTLQIAPTPLGLGGFVNEASRYYQQAEQEGQLAEYHTLVYQLYEARWPGTLGDSAFEKLRTMVKAASVGIDFSNGDALEWKKSMSDSLANPSPEQVATDDWNAHDVATTASSQETPSVSSSDVDSADAETNKLDFFAPLPKGWGFTLNKDTGRMVMTEPWFYEEPEIDVIPLQSYLRGYQATNGTGDARTRIRRRT